MEQQVLKGQFAATRGLGYQVGLQEDEDMQTGVGLGERGKGQDKIVV